MADEKASADSYQPARYDDPSAKFWSAYLAKSEKYDKALVQNWKGDMDSILIFAGLFSASVTAFIIESYRNLMPDPNATSVALLAQIAHHLAVASNALNSTDTPLVALTQPTFIPDTSVLICNTLWFLSLAFSLMCALSATLIEQWARNYLHAADNRPAPQDRARIGAFLSQGLEKYKMSAVVETIPILLHISLFLFFAGLVAFLYPVNSAIGYLMMTMLLICCGLYAVVTFLPIIHLDSPYRTPASTLWWKILQMFQLLQRETTDGETVPLLCPMAEARELEATEITSERDERDLRAMCWTINSLREDSELEPFVEVISNVVAGFDYSAKLLLHRLLHHDDITIKLGYRIPQLLLTCHSGILDNAAAQKRAATCLTAMWSLTMMAMPADAYAANIANSPRSTLRFNEDTLDLLNTVRQELPSVDEYATSTVIVVARGLLDMHVNRAMLAEEKLSNLILEENFQKDEVAMEHDYNAAHQQSLIQIERQLQALEQQVSAYENFPSAVPFVRMEAIAQQHSRLLTMVAASPKETSKDIIFNTLETLKAFQVVLNQAGFLLALRYTADMLASPTIPYEASNTIRRAFFRMDFSLHVSQESQSLLVTYLDEALENEPSGGTRLPMSVADILLSLTRALDDPICILKAKGIINRYLRLHRHEAAAKALSRLDEELPVDECPDLFTTHMYANARTEKHPDRKDSIDSMRTL